MYHIQELESQSVALGGSCSIPLNNLWKRRSGKFTRLAGLLTRISTTVDQAASGGSAITWDALSCLVASVGLASSYEPYGVLYSPSLTGMHVRSHIAPSLLGLNPHVVNECEDIASSDGDSACIVDFPIWFEDQNLERPEDTCLAPQALVNDTLNLTLGAAAAIAAFSTGAVFKGTSTIKTYAFYHLSDEAQIGMPRRWSLTTRTADKITLPSGAYPYIIGLNDVYGGAANGLDTLNYVTVQQGGLYINMPVDAIAMAEAISHMETGRGKSTLYGSTLGAFDTTTHKLLYLKCPSLPKGQNKITDDPATGPLTLEFAEDSVGGCSKMIVGQHVGYSDDQVRRMAQELYGITNPSVMTKTVRPGNPNLPEWKANLLPRTVRAL